MAEMESFSGRDLESTEELIALEGTYRVDSLVGAFEEGLRMKADRMKLTNQLRIRN
jgi:hypothetical protein